MVRAMPRDPQDIWNMCSRHHLWPLTRLLITASAVTGSEYLYIFYSRQVDCSLKELQRKMSRQHRVLCRRALRFPRSTCRSIAAESPNRPSLWHRRALGTLSLHMAHSLLLLGKDRSLANDTGVTSLYGLDKRKAV